jgi:hypothetical protein
VDVAGAACPGQRIETVDMPRSEAISSFGKTTESNAALEKAKELGYDG